MTIFIHELASQDCDKIYEYTHPIKFQPQVYVAKEVAEKLVLDGKLNESSWTQTAWSSDFQDIEGELRVSPERKTNVKMLFDDEYLYIGAMLEEEHIWHKLTKRDAIIYHDDDFEVFIDADGNGHNYQEFEVNANNVLMDLWLLYPYRVPAPKHYLMEWDARGIRTAVHLEGTANQPHDFDAFWSVEMAIPLKLLGEAKDFWRVNFSRVDWLVDVKDGEYHKRVGERERNWVWSPTGTVDMHKPETWGYLAFDKNFQVPDSEHMKWEMWKTYHALIRYKSDHGSFPTHKKCISAGSNIDIEFHEGGFNIIGTFARTNWILNESGLIKRTRG